ncbi:MAG TPA: hypothetical protein VK211_16685 [Kamptonema sp.]|nr:hypothetical protein [Kamptonema sp.]
MAKSVHFYRSRIKFIKVKIAEENMNLLKILIVDESLIFAPAPMDKSRLEGLKLSLIYAQLAARGTGESPDSSGYFSEVQKKLETKGWLVNSSRNSSISLQELTTPKSLAEFVLKPFVAPLIPKNNVWPSWEIILRFFENASTQTEISDALNFWWKNVYTNGLLYMSIGAIFPTNTPSMPFQVEIIRFGLDPSQIKVEHSGSGKSTFNPEIWSSLFKKEIVQIPPIEIQNLSLKLDISRYQEGMNYPLKQKLISAVEAHVRSV